MTAELTELTRVVGAFPKELAREVLDFALFLRDRRMSEVVEYEDWTDEDLRAATTAAAQRVAAEYPDEDWGTDYDAEVQK
jgi:hypothetical protein